MGWRWRLALNPAPSDAFDLDHVALPNHDDRTPRVGLPRRAIPAITIRVYADHPETGGKVNSCCRDDYSCGGWDI